MEHLQYPVGRFTFDDKSFDINQSIQIIKNFSDEVHNIASKLQHGKLDIPYRTEGWTARQVIHHVADSHSHALLRIKCTLSEDNPTIKPYMEDQYALLSDYKLPVESAILILQGVHLKWAFILENLNEFDLDREYYHPGYQKHFTIKQATALYDWHCRHHLGHLQICLSND
jgi:hypothetical protein